MRELEGIAHEEWLKIHQECCLNLLLGYASCLQQVIAKTGALISSSCHQKWHIVLNFEKPLLIIVVLMCYLNYSCLSGLSKTAESLYILPIKLTCNGSSIIWSANVALFLEWKTVNIFFLQIFHITLLSGTPPGFQMSSK